MWLGWFFASTVHYGIRILSLTLMARLRHRQYSTYGIRILSARTKKSVDKTREAMI
jgi:hypothetical protein